MVLDKGPIVDSHVLVLPVEHYPSQLSLSASSFAEMERYLSALQSCFASQVILHGLQKLSVFPICISENCWSLRFCTSLGLWSVPTS